MKYGYMAGYRGDLISELQFAKNNFDFVEITFNSKNLQQHTNPLPKIKDILNEFEVIGHLNEKFNEFEDIVKNIQNFKFLDAKKVTIHPFQEFNLKENVYLINKVNSYCFENGITLMIENLSKPPFCFVNEMIELFNNIPNAKFTLDIGHANINNQLNLFLKTFKNKINHVHIHDNLSDLDHLFFLDKENFNKIISKLKFFKYNDTVLLETFAILEGSINQFDEIKNEHVKQIKNLELFSTTH